jgi:DNA polymerase-1
VLFDELGLTKKRRGKTGFSTDARVLSQIREEHEIVSKVEQWRELTKLKNTYLDALPELIDPDTGRLHTTFNQTATATGRLSSTNPNLPTIPIRTEEGRPSRSCFVAPGQRLLSADYNQIELDPRPDRRRGRLREIFPAGEDIHARPPRGPRFRSEEGDPGDRSRRRWSTTGSPTASRPTASPIGSTSSRRRPPLHRAVLRAVPGREALHRGDDRGGEEEGYVSTLLGAEVRPIPELRSGRPQVRGQGERLAVNMPIQGTSADIIKIAMVASRKAIAESGLETRLVLQIHDELLFEGPAAEMEAASELVEREMCRAFDLDPPLAVDVGIGRTGWPRSSERLAGSWTDQRVELVRELGDSGRSAGSGDRHASTSAAKRLVRAFAG